MGVGTMKCPADLSQTGRDPGKMVCPAWKMVCAGAGQKAGLVVGEPQSDRQRQELAGVIEGKEVIPEGAEEVRQVSGVGQPRCDVKCCR